MEDIELHIEPKPARRIIIVGGGCGCVGMSVEHAMARLHLHDEVDIIDIGAIERVTKPDEDSIEAVIAQAKMIRQPQLVLTLEDMCMDADDSNCSLDNIKKDKTKFYDHYYKSRRRK